MKPLSKNIIIFVVALLIIGAILSTYSINSDKPEEIGIGTLVEMVHADQVSNITVQGDEVSITDSEGNISKTRKEGGEPLSDLLTNYGVSPEELEGITIDIESQSGMVYLTRIILPSLIPLLFLVIIIFFFIKQFQGANMKAMQFGQSKAKKADKDGEKITFKNVAGVAEAKDELMEVVEFLKTPKKFVELGAKIPKGVLLMGSPGTGKTLLGRAVAGEADVPFYHISGSEFVEMFVGVGASRVRDLFNEAKKNAPCIVFIDEIDAVGRQRGAGLGGSHDEREQTLNQILVEMDGFDPHLGVIVLAATNRPDVLDPALLRPGRFDRRVIIDLPDINDREAILTIHAENKPLDGVNIRRVAERTPGFSGADLANLLNEAAILAARRDKKKIGTDEVLESVEKVLLGPARKSHILSKDEKKITAYHEAGHALVAHKLPNADPVHKISLISRGHAAGYTLKLPTEDRKLHGYKEFVDEMAVFLGGYVAEKKYFSNVTTGPSDDLKRATRLARDLVTRYGMSDKLGPRTFGEREEMVFLGKEIREQRDYSDATAQMIDEEVSSLIDQAVKTAQQLLTDNADQMEKIVELLLEKETIEKEEFEALFE
jgi:cell division protease FtsH